MTREASCLMDKIFTIIGYKYEDILTLLIAIADINARGILKTVIIFLYSVIIVLPST